jgi:hypothetical protein
VSVVRDLLRRHAQPAYDAEREEQAEERAAELLRSCVNDDEWAVYSEHGFIPVAGADDRYAFLIYPHKPIVAYVPQTGEILSEYCVAFLDESEPDGSPRLPASDDVLAKWLALTAGEQELIAAANVHPPGKQVDPQRVARDLTHLVLLPR